MPVTALFAYGTLMVPAVMQRVTGAAPVGVPARLDGHARYRVRGAVYPGIVPKPGAVTEGLLFKDLDEAAWRLLDDFEDRQYERVIVRCMLPHNARVERAYTYRVRRRASLTSEPWSLEAFVDQHLEDYLR